ncbi:hypothetical protein C5167_025376 [Papaver somniferum]|uniref:Secreted protein n=1 Tax=Papaver somniferum TaxID=3469 RepID=A0A4Y7JUB1_PAPSO|nr:hypothetical protein C5167_025376 [Papaver somniferum]
MLAAGTFLCVFSLLSTTRVRVWVRDHIELPSVIQLPTAPLPALVLLSFPDSHLPSANSIEEDASSGSSISRASSLEYTDDEEEYTDDDERGGSVKHHGI